MDFSITNDAGGEVQYVAVFFDNQDVFVNKDTPTKNLGTIRAWLSAILVMSMLQFATIVGIIVTWIFQFNNSMKFVLISLFEVPIIFSCVIVLVVFFQFREWTKRILVDQSAYTLLLTFIGLELVTLVLVAIEFIWRAVLFAQCDTGEPCSTSPQFGTSVLLMFFTCLSLVDSLVTVAGAFVLYNKIHDSADSIEFTTLSKFTRKLEKELKEEASEEESEEDDPGSKKDLGREDQDQRQFMRPEAPQQILIPSNPAIFTNRNYFPVETPPLLEGAPSAGASTSATQRKHTGRFSNRD